MLTSSQRLVRWLLFVCLVFVCLGLGSVVSCTCSPPPILNEEGGNDGGSKIINPGIPVKPPENWGQKKMSLGETCGLFTWGNLDCETDLVCAKVGGGKQGLCLRSCSGESDSCGGGLLCQEVTAGTWACLTKEKLSAPGTNCEEKPCQPPYLCVRSKEEKEVHCRPPCDPSPKATKSCKEGFICGILQTHGGSCIPTPAGTVKEFGRCGDKEGRCLSSPVILRCVAEQSRSPLWGSCLRPCSERIPCPNGQHCLASINVCAHICDISKGDVDCSYGKCLNLAREPNISVCY